MEKPNAHAHAHAARSIAAPPSADASSARLHKRVRTDSRVAAAAVWWSNKQQRLDREHSRRNDITSDDSNDLSHSAASGENSVTEHSITSSAHVGPVDDSTSSSYDAHSADSTLLQRLTTAASHFTWRLPSTQPLDASERYLNDQLVHVMGAAAAELNATARRNGLTAQELEVSEQEEAAICRLHLVERVWAVIASQTAHTAAGKEKLQREKDAAEASVRNALDLVSLLLYLRSQELRRETELSERLTLLERELQRTSQQTQTLTLELDAARERLSQQESQHRAKELAFATERKTLLVEKKALEVMVARLQGVETAFKAQLRRKDAEYERLRKNLQDAVGRKEQRGIASTKPLNGPTERKQSLQHAQSRESHATRQIVDALERKKAELLSENDALVSNYSALQRQLEQLTSQYRKAAHLFLAKRGPDGQSDELRALTSVPIDNFAPTAFEMPSKQRLPQLLVTSMDALERKLAQLDAAMREDLAQDAHADREEAIALLQQKLEDAHAIIVEQDQLLQASLASAPSGLNARHRVDDGVDVEHLEAIADDLTLQQRELSQQMTHIAKERELLRTQAMKLDQDRLAFEVEKQALVLGDVDRRRAGWDDVAMSDAQTPSKQQAAQPRPTDLDVSMDSPVRVPVPASPRTAALLEKMGIVAYDGGFAGS